MLFSKVKIVKQFILEVGHVLIFQLCNHGRFVPLKPCHTCYKNKRYRWATSRWRYRDKQIICLRKVASQNIVSTNSRLRQNFRQRLSLQNKFVYSDIILIKICRIQLIKSNLSAKANIIFVFTNIQCTLRRNARIKSRGRDAFIKIIEFQFFLRNLSLKYNSFVLQPQILASDFKLRRK